METIMIAISGVLASFFLFRGWKNYAGKRSTLKREKRVLDRVLPILKSFENNEAPDQNLINELAEDPFTRDRIHFILSQNESEDLFPKKYLNRESAAESALVYWLNHGKELGENPAEITFTKIVSQTITKQDIDVDYFVFKFRETEDEEHKDGPYWMVGIAGPYIPSEPIYTFAPGTFSTFNEYDSQSPEEHVEWLHDMMEQKGMY